MATPEDLQVNADYIRMADQYVEVSLELSAFFACLDATPLLWEYLSTTFIQAITVLNHAIRFPVAQIIIIMRTLS